MKINPKLLVSSLAVSLLAAGCATPKPPIHRAEGFRPEAMNKVYLLPLVDGRVDKKLNKDYNKLVQKNAAAALKGLRYPREVVTDPASISLLSAEDLRQPNADVISRTGPADARWMMAFVLEDVSRKVVFLGATGNAELGMYILDKQAGTVVWHDKAVSRMGQGGLLGMASVGFMDSDALRLATSDILRRIPKHPKQRSSAGSISSAAIDAR
jgi:hypothetical protein